MDTMLSDPRLKNSSDPRLRHKFSQSSFIESPSLPTTKELYKSLENNAQVNLFFIFFLFFRH